MANNWQVALVPDTQLNAGMVTRLLDKDPGATYSVTVFASLAELADGLQQLPADIAIIIAERPEPVLPRAVRSLTAPRPDVPVVVLYGGEDDTVGEQCVREGASDALPMLCLNTVTLRLLIAAAIGSARMNTARLAERRAAAFELVGHQIVHGWLAATQGWDPLLRQRTPDRFKEAVDAYGQVLVEWMRNKRDGKRQSRAPLRHIAALIERLRGRPQDVVDIHAHAVAAAVRGMEQASARAIALESHGLALEVTGRLEAVKEAAPWARSQVRRTSGATGTSNAGVRRTSTQGSVNAPRRTSGLLGDEPPAPASVRRVSMGFDRAGSSDAIRRTSAYGERRRSGAADVVEVTGRKEPS